MAISGVPPYLITSDVLPSVSARVPVDMQSPSSDGGKPAVFPITQSCLDVPEKCQSFSDRT